MRSPVRDRGLALGALLVLCAAPALAARPELPALHVTALGMHADVRRASPGQVFHIIIHVHTNERVTQLNTLLLPQYTNLDLLGDVRALSQNGTGTDYVETLSVAGIAPGPAHLTPATLDAVDARSGRPSRFSSNEVTIQIGDQPQSAGATLAWLWATLLTLARFAMVAVGLLAAGFVVFAIVRSRRFRQPAPPPPVPEPVVSHEALPPVQTRSRLRTTLDTLRAEPTRSRAAEVREVLFDLAGAHRGETLSSLLARHNGAEPGLRAALRIAERATFVDEAYVRSAIEELLAAAERVAQ